MQQLTATSDTSPADARSLQSLVQMALGQQIAAIVIVYAQLGLADLIAGGPMTGGALAEALGANPASLLRYLRACASLDLLRQHGPDLFALGPLGEYLRSDSNSIRGFVMGMTSPVATRSWERLRDGVLTGKTVLNDVLGMDVWEWALKNPDELAVLQDQWKDMSIVTANALVQHYDLSGYRRIVDIGANLGFSTSILMHAAPQASFVLMDQPLMIAMAEELLAEAGITERVEFVGGDFFQAVPEGGDLYLLKGVLLDITDEQVVQVLENCHRAAAPGSRLLSLEGLIPADRPAPATVHISDLHMLLTLGGRYRMESESEQLFRRAGYQLRRVIPAPVPQGLYHLLEASRV